MASSAQPTPAPVNELAETHGPGGSLVTDALSICLGVSGSVAAVKAPEIAEALLGAGVSVDVVVTESAFRLMQATYRGARPWDRLLGLVTTSRPALHVYRDADEWEAYREVGSDPVLHIELAKRNSLLLIAPLCANALAAAAAGLSTGLLGCVLRAWYFDLDPSYARTLAPPNAGSPPAVADRPVLVAPAMNTVMWHQRITAEHLGALQRRGVRVVPPVSKVLACGDEGVGAMAEVEEIVRQTKVLLESHQRRKKQDSTCGEP